MSIIKPELSKANRYYVERHRYYELYHFCRQYDIWKKALHGLDGFVCSDTDTRVNVTLDEHKIEKVAIAREHYQEMISLVEDAAKKADEFLAEYILLGVTKGLTYNQLHTKYNIPCCRGVYYDRYRKFFWHLNSSRN